MNASPLHSHSEYRRPYHFHMANGDIRETLWASVRALMLARYKKENINQFASDCGLGVATVQRIKDREQYSRTDTIERIAKTFKVKPWQLLAPGMDDDKFLALVALWNDTDSRGRRMLLGAVRGAEHEEDAEEGGSVSRTGQR